MESNYVGRRDFYKQDKYLWGDALQRRFEERQGDNRVDHSSKVISSRMINSFWGLMGGSFEEIARRLGGKSVLYKGKAGMG